MITPVSPIARLVLAAALSTLAAGVSAADLVRVGFSDSPPISSRDPATMELRGLAISVFRDTAVEAGFTTEQHLMSFGDLLPALASGKIDVVTMSGTPERRKLAIFSRPFARYGEALLVRKDDATPYTKLDELKGKRVGSNAGGGWIDAARTAGAEIVTFPGAEQSLSALDKGEVDAVVGNAPTYVHLLRSGAYPNARVAQTYVPRQVNELAFGLRAGDAERLARIDAALEKLSTRGALDRLRSEWGF